MIVLNVYWESFKTYKLFEYLLFNGGKFTPGTVEYTIIADGYQYLAVSSSFQSFYGLHNWVTLKHTIDGHYSKHEIVL